MKAIKVMLLGIAILLVAINFHLFHEGELGIFLAIIGIIVVILGYNTKDAWDAKDYEILSLTIGILGLFSTILLKYIDKTKDQKK